MFGGRNQRFSRNGGQGWNERDEIGNLFLIAKGFGMVLGKCSERGRESVLQGLVHSAREHSLGLRAWRMA